MSIRIEYIDIPVGSDKDATFTSNDGEVFSDLSRVPFGAFTSQIANLELNKWGLDGNFEVFGNQDFGFWSTAISNVSGNFSKPPKLTLTLASTYTSSGISLIFDQNNFGYCSSINISWTLNGTEISNKTFSPDSPQYYCDNRVEGYNGVVFTFLKTSLPYRRAIVSMIILGIVRVFESDKLLSVKILKQINPICLELLIGTLNWSLINTDNISFMFQFKQPVRVYNDETLLGVFYITDSKRESIDKYSINCEDAIGVLNDIPIAANVFNGANVKTLIESWINENFHLEIDDSLANLTVTGYIPPSTLRTAIQQVCFAIGAICTSSDTGNIKIYKPDSSNIVEIADDRTFAGGSVETTSAITELRVFAHTYTQTTTPQAGDDIINIGNLKYIHSTTWETIINPNIKPNVKSKIIEIKEATLVDPTKISNIIQEVYRFYEKVNKHNVSFRYNQEQLGQTVTTTTPYKEKVIGILQKIEFDENVFLAKSEILY